MKVSFVVRILLLCFACGFQIATAWSINCNSSRSSFVRRQFARLDSESLPTADVIEVHESPPSTCFNVCESDRNCSGYFVDYRNNSCLIVRNIDSESLEKYIVRDDSSSFHRKTCLPEISCNHEWAFDEIQGVQLFHYHDKTIYRVHSGDSCMSLCLQEPTFTCRSARFDKSKSECVLSRHDRRSAAEYFRQSPNPASVLYLERQCVSEPQGCLFRGRQSRSATSLRHRHVQVVSNAITRDACEKSCVSSAPFACRSYQFVGSNKKGENPTCLLSPEDSLSEQSVVESSFRHVDPTVQALGDYFEKESCIDVDIKCEASAMRVSVRVSTPFRGRVYAAGHPYECYSVSVSEGGEVVLMLSLHGRHCGTKNLGNGTFVNSVVVQHHPFVLRTTDRRIDVACDYEEMKLKIRGSKAVKHSELKPLSHTVTAVAPTPPIRLRVVNSTDQDVTGVELGDPLFLKVEMTDESVYGIFGSDLVARSSGGSETVLLINDDGCPVEPTVIQALDRLPGSKSLYAPFQAFKFASDSGVKFQMTVSYCLDNCTPANCEVPKSNQAHSYGKRKKRKKRSTKLLDLLPGDVIDDVIMESPTFLVTNLKSPVDLDNPKLRPRWAQQLQLRNFSEGHVLIKTHKQNFCVSMTTLYVTFSVIAGLQLGIVLTCAFIYFSYSGTNRKKNYITSRSSPSISSRRNLVCDHE